MHPKPFVLTQDRRQPDFAVRPDQRCSSRRIAGQAMVETLLVGLLLSLAAGLTVLLARLHDIDRSSVDAAGAIAMECAVARSVCPSDASLDQPSASIVRRTLGEGDRQVLSGDGWGPSPGQPRLRAFWTGSDGQPLIPFPGAIQATRRPLSFDAGIEVARVGVLDDSFGRSLIERFGPGRFGLAPRDGLTVTELSVPVSALWPGQPTGSTGRGLELSLTRRAAVLADAWNASVVTGNAQDSVESRVRRGHRLEGVVDTVIQTGYAPVRGALRAAGAVGLEPSGSRFTNEQLDVSIVPSDRVPR
ncbi:MAG: hypothetical protein RL322_2774 [Pseudomonadota bacterium]|jgi:hypothetical protein